MTNFVFFSLDNSYKFTWHFFQMANCRPASRYLEKCKVYEWFIDFFNLYHDFVFDCVLFVTTVLVIMTVQVKIPSRTSFWGYLELYK